MSTAVKNVIAACESQNRENLRFIMFGVYGIDENGDLPTHIAQSVLGYLSPSKYGPAMEDHKRCLALLKSSTLNYTVFQTAVMVDRPFGSPYMTGETPEDVPGMRLWSKIGILDAADCVLNRVDKNDMKELYMAYAA
ncbi:hypothetical protein SARC_14795 [Sphaeroforma arctica JP610]|uniref:NAD(P)-binding domain-containing protein n=1 Tax=Sphaeroforma arctica JP610 TaxID=667725 RepID=A0A0L0F964_9EUKA|nr:hypothetical protein SARC_14795 [Sphaeroforma arctica JP610]KNC72648.1 hypothetical protein SARC_14795 [Sphaeroforma arctica JP610]|eukprot:XP_014146550.1 hypothetical protein SARC_14795 [Sphaeroforma arctica JP610]